MSMIVLPSDRESQQTAAALAALPSSVAAFTASATPLNMGMVLIAKARK
jgi:hypothetical protein